jgi:Xaa-Pro aminopeptidase
MAISEKEYQRRYTAIRQIMKTEDLDCLLVVGLSDDFNRGNIRYITGYGRGGCCIFPRTGSPIFFISPTQWNSPKLPHIIEAFSLLELKEVTSSVEQTVKELSRFDAGKKIGLIGFSCISVPLYLALKEKFAEKLVSLPEFLKPLREIKSSEEIEKLRTSALIADKVYKRLREIIRPGLSEFSIYGEVKKVIYEEGCEYSFDLLDAAASQMNMAFFPTVDKLQTSGTLFMEISPAYQGYYAQLPVTLPVGKYRPNIQKMVKAWNQADQAARPMLHAGTKISDIYSVLVNTIRDNGFVSPLRPGHSVGLDILDFWSIDESNNAILKSGMVIAVHPCSMEKKGGDGVGMGYTYLISESGAERFSKVDLAAELLGEA